MDYRVANVDVPNDKSCSGGLKPQTDLWSISYSQVCGRLRGYQVGTPDAFGSYVNEPKPDLVMDGVMISHGKARKHIWAYASGHEKQVVN